MHVEKVIVRQGRVAAQQSHRVGRGRERARFNRPAVGRLDPSEVLQRCLGRCAAHIQYLCRCVRCAGSSNAMQCNAIQQLTVRTPTNNNTERACYCATYSSCSFSIFIVIVVTVASSATSPAKWRETIKQKIPTETFSVSSIWESFQLSARSTMSNVERYTGNYITIHHR